MSQANAKVDTAADTTMVDTSIVGAVLDGRYPITSALPAPRGWQWWATGKEDLVVAMRLLPAECDADERRARFAEAAGSLEGELKDWAVWTKGELAVSVAGYIVVAQVALRQACRHILVAERDAEAQELQEKAHEADAGGKPRELHLRKLGLGDFGKFALGHPSLIWVSLGVVVSCYLWNWAVALLPQPGGIWYWVSWGLIFIARMLFAGGGFSLVLWLWLRGEQDARVGKAGLGMVIGGAGCLGSLMLALLLGVVMSN